MDELNAAVGTGSAQVGDFAVVGDVGYEFSGTMGWVPLEPIVDDGDQITEEPQLPSTLKSLSETLGKLIDSGYLFGGILGPLSTLPLGVLDEHKVFFLALSEGTYNISGLVLKKDEAAIIYHKKKGKYSYEKIALAKKSAMEELAKVIENLNADLKNTILVFDGFTDGSVYNGRTSQVDEIRYNTRIKHFVAIFGGIAYYEWDGWEFWNNENGSARTEKIYINSSNHSIYHFEGAKLISGICLAADSDDNTEYDDV